jgi:hypothetical protein
MGQCEHTHVGSPKKLCRQVSKLDQLVTVHYVAINNQVPSVYVANITHLYWARANSKMPLFWGPAAESHGHKNRESICRYKQDIEYILCLTLTWLYNDMSLILYTSVITTIWTTWNNVTFDKYPRLKKDWRYRYIWVVSCNWRSWLQRYKETFK